jgi:hypothetical protein
MQKELHELLEALPREGGHRTRIRNALAYHGRWDDGCWHNDPIVSLDQLTALTHSELLRKSGLGRRGISMLEKVMAERGLYLGGTFTGENGRRPPPDSWRDTLNELT